MTQLDSKIYEGWVRHRRFIPKQHEFRYRIHMLYINLDELDTVLRLSRLWSSRPWALARFKRTDFHGEPDLSIKDSVLSSVYDKTGERPEGKVFMLTNLRYFGYLMNPLSTYYCFDGQGRLHSLVAEVTNTPWRERHSYVLRCNQQTHKQDLNFAKAFHVSPLNEMEMNYRWRSNTPANKAYLHLENWQDGSRVMDATLALNAKTMSAENLNGLLYRFPWLSAKTILAIYWEALRTWLKGVPYVSHPDQGKPNEKVESEREESVS